MRYRDIKFNYVIKTGNNAVVNYTVFDGEYMDVETETGLIENQYVRDTIIRTGDVVFNYYPVPAGDIDRFLRQNVSQDVPSNVEILESWR